MRFYNPTSHDTLKHTDKSLMNLFESNQIWIVNTLSLLIWHSNGVPVGAKIIREKCNYNPY